MKGVFGLISLVMTGAVIVWLMNQQLASMQSSGVLPSGKGGEARGSVADDANESIAQSYATRVRRAVPEFEGKYQRLPKSLDELRREWPFKDPPKPFKFRYNPGTGDVDVVR